MSSTNSWVRLWYEMPTDPKWSFGSYYLWGDIPALMVIPTKAQKFNPDGTQHGTGSWFKIADSKNRGASVGGDGDRNRLNPGAGIPAWAEPHGSCIAESRTASSILATGATSSDGHKGFRREWEGRCQLPSKSPRRRAASAQIAKIPFPLAQHIARCFKPDTQERVA